jgi:putative transposase
MSNIHRYYVPDSIVFITTVTKDRRSDLVEPTSIGVFWDTVSLVHKFHPFELVAYIILPDHFHWLIKPANDTGNYSSIMHSLKRNFTLNFKKAHGLGGSLQYWQYSFWDRIVRSEKEFARYLRYIHWNPVKHHYVSLPEEWPYSSYSDWSDLIKD